MLSTVTGKGQVTIPKSIRDALGINPNDRVAFIREGERVLLHPIRTLKSFRGAVKTNEPGSFIKERAQAKAAVARRVVEESE
jgi:AbrB family looped-hinge helix DNA binding protein